MSWSASPFLTPLDFLILARLFWNQILICDSFKFSSLAKYCLFSPVKYLHFSNSCFKRCSWELVNAVRGRFEWDAFESLSSMSSISSSLSAASQLSFSFSLGALTTLKNGFDCKGEANENDEFEDDEDWQVVSFPPILLHAILKLLLWLVGFVFNFGFFFLCLGPKANY